MHRAKSFEIGYRPWGGAYHPAAYAEMTAIPDGIRFCLWCEEPFAVPACTQDNGPVYMDSCLEAFVDFYPQAKRGYINFEMNAAGALLMQFGPDRGHRRFLTRAETGPKVNPFTAENTWGVQLDVPFSFVQEVYTASQPPDPACLRGNFYKCGSAPEHYICWAPVQTPAPDFHRPEFFQTLWLFSRP